jgi:hypothetical protein
MQPRRDLPVDAPARLAGHEIASAIWRRMMRQYNELEAQIVTRMDQDLLIDYCILTEQVTELDELRKSAFKAWKSLDSKWPQVEEQLEAKELMRALVQLQSAFTDIVKLDGRVDRKRALLLQLRQSLYMTPRARAGAAPKEKEKELPKSAMAKLLDDVVNDVTDFVHDEHDGQ